MFKTYNPSSRLPIYLQNGTKENIAFQLIATAIFVGGYVAWESYKERREAKRFGLDQSDK